MKTGIIIPCYNEEKRINQEAFVRFAREHDDFHLCFVNDGSKDQTLKILNKMRTQVPTGISIVDVKKNSGKATAVRAGARYLYTLEDIEYIGFMDADLSTDFRDFKDLVKTLKRERVAMVFGSRNSGGGGIERSFMRSVFSNFIKQFILIILGLPIRDTQCGAKVFSREQVPVLFEQSFVSKWLFDVELFLRLKKNLGKAETLKQIIEQPLMRWVHVDDSRLGVKDAIEIPGKLAQIWLTYTLPAVMHTSTPSPEPAFAIYAGVPELRIAA